MRSKFTPSLRDGSQAHTFPPDKRPSRKKVTEGSLDAGKHWRTRVKTERLVLHRDVPVGKQARAGQMACIGVRIAGQAIADLGS